MKKAISGIYISTIIVIIKEGKLKMCKLYIYLALIGTLVIQPAIGDGLIDESNNNAEEEKAIIEIDSENKEIKKYRDEINILENDIARINQKNRRRSASAPYIRYSFAGLGGLTFLSVTLPA